MSDATEVRAVTDPSPEVSDEQLIAMLVDRARSEGLQLSGEGGLLQQSTKRVLESALEGEVTDHLGYDKHDQAGRNSGNSRNGTRSKTVITDVGPIEVKVPRDTAGTFEPQIVRKRQRRGEGAEFWMGVLTEIRNRGVRDVFFGVCDGLKGLPEVVEHVWPLATVQTCIIHLIRNTFRLAPRQHWDALKRDLKPIYTAVNADAARAALDDLTEKWGTKYAAIPRLWNNAWEEFIPFLDYDIEIRRVICSTNAIESLNARYRRAVKARGLSPPSRPR